MTNEEIKNAILEEKREELRKFKAQVDEIVAIGFNTQGALEVMKIEALNRIGFELEETRSNIESIAELTDNLTDEHGFLYIKGTVSTDY